MVPLEFPGDLHVIGWWLLLLLVFGVREHVIGHLAPHGSTGTPSAVRGKNLRWRGWVARHGLAARVVRVDLLGLSFSEKKLLPLWGY